MGVGDYIEELRDEIRALKQENAELKERERQYLLELRKQQIH